MREQFEVKRFRGDSLAIIEQANVIIEQYKAQGLTLTLRQLYYQFVSRDLFENSQNSYDKLGTIITNGRIAGLIDWAAIEDLERQCVSWLIEESQRGALQGIERRFALDMWTPQNAYIEVWVEKKALSNVIERPCMNLNVPYLACKGYLSSTAAYDAGKRFERAHNAGKKCVMIHLGDHDPSGLDMTRDNNDRLKLFARQHGIKVDRIALNMDQIRKYKPPPNPAKKTDKRFAAYREQYCSTSWELDALEPSVIDGLITRSVERYIDRDIWDDTKVRQAEKRTELARLHQAWPDVNQFMQGNHDQQKLLAEVKELLYDHENHEGGEDERDRFFDIASRIDDALA